MASYIDEQSCHLVLTSLERVDSQIDWAVFRLRSCTSYS